MDEQALDECLKKIDEVIDKDIKKIFKDGAEAIANLSESAIEELSVNDFNAILALKLIVYYIGRER